MTHSLTWTGLLCCISALLLHLFPGLAFRIGAEPSAAWLVFGFGAFLMIIATVAASGGHRRSQKGD